MWGTEQSYYFGVSVAAVHVRHVSLACLALGRRKITVFYRSEGLGKLLLRTGYTELFFSCILLSH